METLYEKALICALKDLKYAITREQANKVYLKWKSFHKNVQFRKAVKEKQDNFKTKKID